jgi:hypothetical protein
MPKSWKVSALLVVLCLCVLMSGCYGTFSLTKRLHHWNGSQGNQWAQEGLFLLIVIVPIYGLCMLGDALIFNSIEFWGGDNPIDGTAMNGAGPTGEMDQMACVVGLPYQATLIGTTAAR